MAERNGVITFQGDPLTLVGDPVEKGQTAPDLCVLDNDLTPVTLKDFSGKTIVICSVPSLDTPVCDMEIRKFNEQAASLGDNIKILFISMDLPFAQKRFCVSSEIENVQTLSDHRDASFGQAFGLLIKELRLLARAVIIIDTDSKIRYLQIVDDITHEPDYDTALKTLGEIA